MKSRRRWPARVTLGYIAILACSFAAAMIAGWSSLAEGMEGSAYDSMFRVQPSPARKPTSVVLAIDERTLSQTGGMRNFRGTLAEVLRRLRQDEPAVVAIDSVLADAVDPQTDGALEKSLADTPNLVLGADVVPGLGHWEDPLPVFARHAKRIGHVHASPDPVSRKLP